VPVEFIDIICASTKHYLQTAATTAAATAAAAAQNEDKGKGTAQEHTSRHMDDHA